MDFAGTFEFHITCAITTPLALERLHQWGRQHDLKFVHIQLDCGQYSSQPMLTGAAEGTLNSVAAIVRELVTQLAAADFAVNRCKIEAAPWNADIPQTPAQAASQPADYHFEHHLKLLLEPGCDITALRALVQRHNAHLSQNARRQRTDGRSERFVSQRCYGLGQPAARADLATLQADLATHGYHILDSEEEYVVFDSNLALDAGWLEASASIRS